jgi:catechol 2,3-dioxygenase-like lactoylglutathione lyase family enzyme
MLQHVSLEVRREQVDACLAFWRLLGFQRVEPPTALAERAAWVQSGPTQVHLMFAEDPVAPPQGHTAVVVEDYAGVFAALLNAGFEPDPRIEHWGAARSFVRDPVGHRVEVMAAPPPGG